ncbi:MAG: MBL fold metallo-hydrolase [Salibacteraceae bacterium]
MKIIFHLFLLLVVSTTAIGQNQKLLILGIAQDAGYPQIACSKPCCQKVEKPESPVSLAIIDTDGYLLFEATPDVGKQIKMVNDRLGNSIQELPKAIFITHAHIGHYLGLSQFGREALGGVNQPVYTMPRFKSFLESNAPWNQLVNLNNISPIEMQKNEIVEVGQTKVLPIQVPHRDELSETVGFIINGNSKRVLFIPDIDKWEKWNVNIDSLIHEVDYALLDGTFYQNGEIKGRNMSEIPHPFVSESMKRFSALNEIDKAKIHFIHFNHTNPILWNDEVKSAVKLQGFNIAETGMEFDL